MGWNEGYRLLEATVIRVYDLGKLDKAMAEALFEPYRGTDIDRGGSCGLTTKDGKTMEEAVAEAWGITLPPKPEDDEDDEAMDDYYFAFEDAYRPIKEYFGFC